MFGLGLSVAILLDATIVRAVLVPAVMKLMGRWNWYLPAGVARVMRLPQAEAAAASSTPTVAPIVVPTSGAAHGVSTGGDMDREPAVHRIDGSPKRPL
jgi:RND superfamily putative drug exporter